MPGRRIRCAFVLGSLLLAAPWASGQPPAGEVLPPPRPLPPPPVPAPPPVPVELMLFPHPDRYAVWQYYGVNRYGQWRPRVISNAYRSYYLYNGAPFPWADTHPEEWAPRAYTPANFSR
jgi:hypothetical protein